MAIKPIKTEADYHAALEHIEDLWDAEAGTPEGDELDVLSLLVDQYEATHFPIEAPDPIAAIEFRMEQLGLEPKDMIPYFGQFSKVSEVLSKKRGLSINMIRRINRELKIPSDILIQEYELVG